MASTGIDPITGHPTFADGDAPDPAVNPTQVAAWAAKVGTRLIGTTAERLAYDHARNGLEWYDTDKNLLYTHDGTGWHATVIERGIRTFSTVAYPGGTAAVEFTPGRFTAAPLVQLTKQDGVGAKMIPYVTAITPQGFELGVYAGDGSSSGTVQNLPIAWTATLDV